MRKLLTVICLTYIAFSGAQAQEVLRGPFLFLSTPYFDNGELDYETLAAEAIFNDEGGVSGVIWPSSDRSLISEDEFLTGVKTLIKAMKGRRARLAVSCNAGSTDKIIEYCRFAEKTARAEGVDIILFARPADDLNTLADLRSSLDRIGAAIHSPFIYQTWLREDFPRLPAEDMARLAKKYPGIMGYVKCEFPGASCNDYISEMVAAKPEVHSVFSAWGSWQWLYQYRQLHTDGILSQRPAYPDIYSYIWEELEKGNPDGKADEAFGKMMSMLILRSSIDAPDEHRSFHLYTLCLRGIFHNLVSRVKDSNSPRGWKVHVQPLSEQQKAEVRLRLQAMEPYMRVPLPAGTINES